MTGSADVIVVGAGPGGLEAAATAAEAGMRVCVIDDNSSAGGQIWRSGPGERNPKTERLLRRLEAGRVEMRFLSRAVATPAEQVLRIETGGRFTDIEYSSLVLATGGRERFLPFPGWTLRGIYGAGGLEAFVKSGFDIHRKRAVVAGTGPLLLAIAAHLREAGARIVSVVEQVPAQRLARFSLGLLRGHVGKLMEGAAYGLSIAGIPYRTGSWVTSASGGEQLEKVMIRSGSRILEVPCDLLAVGYHLVPNIELAQLLHCELEGGYVSVDALQQSSVRGVYCVGELTGIGGVDKAEIEGRIAGLAASGQSDGAKPLFMERDRHARFAHDLDAAFALRDELRNVPTASTIVCRCEDVSYGALVQCRSWREAKLHTRCGMGPCQGRICAPATKFLFGWTSPAPRPPLFPAEVETLAHTTDVTA
ncbi:MAG TPA: FAD/NAD(P)-binding oxidoreductase [Terracidiphilus sp.]|jgi:NADPH-dependent 2,4-dienoyl-CoA reductase/sulfur reductase-like enzyme